MKRRVMKLSILTIGLALFTGTAFAQVAGGSMTKLFDLYVMGDYEKCYDKAIKATDDDDTKYESEPYLYAALSLKKIQEDPELRQYYEDATKDAIKLAAKFTKRDIRKGEKDEETLFEENKETVWMFQRMAINEAKSFYVQQDWRKASYYLKYGLRIDPSDPAVELFKAVADYKSRNRYNGDKHSESAIKKFKELAQEGGYEPTEFNVTAFEDGFIEYVEYLKEEDELEKAREAASLARKLAPNNSKFERLESNLNG